MLVVLFWSRKVVKKGYCGNGSLSLASGCMEVRQVALYYTTYTLYIEDTFFKKPQRGGQIYPSEVLELNH